MITIFNRNVCTSVQIFKNLAKRNKFQVRIVIAIGGTVGLAEGIIDDACLVVVVVVVSVYEHFPGHFPGHCFTFISFYPEKLMLVREPQRLILFS